MEWFDALDEIFAVIERYVQEHGTAPSELSISPSLYTWLAELQRESAMLEGIPVADLIALETPYGAIPVAIDERLGAHEILAE
jgi:hypothetical protein